MAHKEEFSSDSGKANVFWIPLPQSSSVFFLCIVGILLCRSPAYFGLAKFSIFLVVPLVQWGRAGKNKSLVSFILPSWCAHTYTFFTATLCGAYVAQVSVHSTIHTHYYCVPLYNCMSYDIFCNDYLSEGGGVAETKGKPATPLQY